MKRRPIDRARYNTEEFKEKLRQDCREAASDPEYLAECALWDCTVGDGLEE